MAEPQLMVVLWGVVLLSQWWFCCDSTPVPVGLIVFLNDTSVPSGWERFTSADNRMIVGAGNTYASGGTGGSSIAKTYTETTGSAGLHSSEGGTIDVEAYSTGTKEVGTNATQFGAHTHDIGNFTYNPDKRTALMIKATENHNQFPAKAMLLSASSISGLSNVTDFNGKFIESYTAIADISETKEVALSSGGLHDHEPGSTAGGSGYTGVPYNNNYSSGLHSDTVNATSVTENLKKVLLSLWTHATQQFNVESGMIAMYEGASAPAGWELCDGTNGTPNLQDCFIMPVGSGSENTTPSGDNTIDITFGASVTHSSSHLHGNNEDHAGGSSYVYHDTYAWSHTHSLPSLDETDLSWLPPYYALTFIRKVG